MPLLKVEFCTEKIGLGLLHRRLLLAMKKQDFGCLFESFVFCTEKVNLGCLIEGASYAVMKQTPDNLIEALRFACDGAPHRAEERRGEGASVAGAPMGDKRSEARAVEPWRPRHAQRPSARRFFSRGYWGVGGEEIRVRIASAPSSHPERPYASVPSSHQKRPTHRRRHHARSSPMLWR